jgi:hypothetical protein
LLPISPIARIPDLTFITGSGILKYLIVIFSTISFCSPLAMIATGTEDGYANKADADFPVEFDDFPDNSIPDLEELFNGSSPNFIPKSAYHFTSMPDQNELIDEQSELGLDVHGFPLAVVSGCVNVISGDYQENTVDYSLPGASPLKLQRNYFGNGCRKHSFLSGWQLSHGAKLLTFETLLFNANAVLKGSDRHGVHFKGNYFDTFLTCPKSFFKKFTTNCAFGDINANNNFKNDRLYRQPKGYELLTANQTSYSFSKASSDPERIEKTRAYRLDKLQMPDGTGYRS